MCGVTAQTVCALIGPTARAMRWKPFLAAAGLGLTIVAVPAAMTVVLQSTNLTDLLRIAAICGALGVTFLLDDPAARSTATVPTSRLTRRAVRTGIVIPAAGAWWAAVLTVTTAGAEDDIGATLHLRSITLEAAALFVLACVIAILATRGTVDGIGSTIAAAGLLILVAAISLLPQRAALFVGPDDPRWQSAHHRWMLLLILAVIGGLRSSHEPYARRRSILPGSLSALRSITDMSAP
jgi:fluoroquinolone transport system permease protein